MGDSRIKDVSALLSSFFNEDKLRRGEEVTTFFSSWQSLVGPRLAAHSRISDIDRGLLVVEAEHPGWIQLLQLRQSAILEEVIRRYPELGLRGIVFRLAGQRAEPRPDPVKAAPEPDTGSETEEEREKRDRALSEVTDPEFRALLTSLKKTMQGKG
jgi:hypothetical protein